MQQLHLSTGKLLYNTFCSWVQIYLTKATNYPESIKQGRLSCYYNLSKTYCLHVRTGGINTNPAKLCTGTRWFDSCLVSVGVQVQHTCQNSDQLLDVTTTTIIPKVDFKGTARQCLLPLQCNNKAIYVCFLEDIQPPTPVN